jgi:hypothetical protein
MQFILSRILPTSFGMWAGASSFASISAVTSTNLCYLSSSHLIYLCIHHYQTISQSDYSIAMESGFITSVSATFTKLMMWPILMARTKPRVETVPKSTGDVLFIIHH